jgi:hypothetical protein
MELRTELMPPLLDGAKIRRLSELAARLDGANPGQGDADLTAFNQIAGTALAIDDFQQIYESEDHESWVRRILVKKTVRPVSDVTRSELIEVVRRAMPQNGYPDYEAYMAIFDANVPRTGASILIFYPSVYDPNSNSSGEGRPIEEYDPTPEEIVAQAMGDDFANDRPSP